jgi:hypothetical protein
MLVYLLCTLELLIYKGESMCVCVCPATCLAWAPHFTRTRHQDRGLPEMLAPGHAHFCSLDQSAWDYSEYSINGRPLIK